MLVSEENKRKEDGMWMVGGASIICLGHGNKLALHSITNLCKKEPKNYN